MTMAIDCYRAWLWALTVLWVLTAMAVIALFRAETLRVSRVEVLNSQGKTVAVLGVSPTDGGVLLLYDGLAWGYGASDLKAAKFVLGGCDACNCGSNSTAQR